MSSETSGQQIGRRFRDMALEIHDHLGELRDIAGEQDLRTGAPIYMPAGIIAVAETAGDLLDALGLLIRGHFGDAEKRETVPATSWSACHRVWSTNPDKEWCDVHGDMWPCQSQTP